MFILFFRAPHLRFGSLLLRIHIIWSGPFIKLLRHSLIHSSWRLAHHKNRSSSTREYISKIVSWTCRRSYCYNSQAFLIFVKRHIASGRLGQSRYKLIVSLCLSISSGRHRLQTTPRMFSAVGSAMPAKFRLYFNVKKIQLCWFLWMRACGDPLDSDPLFHKWITLFCV